MALGSVIFDVDGTLADTERDGHRIAFNRAFAKAGLPDRWGYDAESWAEYYGVPYKEPRGVVEFDLRLRRGGRARRRAPLQREPLLGHLRGEPAQDRCGGALCRALRGAHLRRRRRDVLGQRPVGVGAPLLKEVAP